MFLVEKFRKLQTTKLRIILVIKKQTKALEDALLSNNLKGQISGLCQYMRMTIQHK